MNLQLSLWIGLLAAIVMFCGDMLLYYTKEEYISDNTLNPIIAIMKEIPVWRLRFGGLIGPFASFLYCFGFYSITISALPGYKILSVLTCLLLSLGMVVSGTYHSQCTYLGVIKKEDANAKMGALIKNMELISRVSFIITGLGLMLLAAIIVLGGSLYPRWFVVLTPGVLFFMKYIWKALPQPFKIILFGGWYNLMFAVFFSASLFAL